MRHYVLTRSSFGPAWDLAANRRRFAITKAVTARLLGLQTVMDWTWVVALDQRDPLLSERLRLYRDSVPSFVPIVRLPDDRQRRHSAIRSRQRIAAADYEIDWLQAISPNGKILTTRIDDDDGFAPDALARIQAVAAGIETRAALMLPVGVHLWAGRYAMVRHERNAMHTLLAPIGDDRHVYTYGHMAVATFAPVVIIDDEPGWLWTRHRDTISNARNPRSWGGVPKPITPALRALFPIDWSALDTAWG
jgi:Putative rhamnosyl transferase